MRAKVKRKCHVSFVSLGRRRLARLLKCYRIGPGVGVGAGVGVDQEPGVGVGAGAGTAPPRLRTPGQRIRQGHGKGGGWNIAHDRGECAGRRLGLWTPRKEEQVKVKSEDMSRAIRGQSSAGRRAKGRTRQSAGRAGTNTAHGLWISRSLDDGRGGFITSRRLGRRAAYRAG